MSLSFRFSSEIFSMNTHPFSVSLVLLVGMTAAIVFCQQCPGPKDYPKGTFCYCDMGDSYNGWSFSCTTEQWQPVFDVKYVVDSEMTFRCGSDEPYKHPFFKQSVFSDVQTFVFTNCPLPNSSFAEILPSGNIVQLKIQMKHGNANFSATLFKNITSNMTSLILSHNEIRNLPEKIFNNFVILKFLSLSDNFLERLPVKLFWGLPNLEVLELANNRLEHLPEESFGGLLQLEKLYLYKNKLKLLPSGLFRGLSELQVLDLGDNNLIFLPSDIFVGLSRLIHVRLRANKLEKLPKELFNFTDSLQDIDMSFNKFQEPLPEELLFDLSSLEKISMNDCNLSRMHENFFSYSPKITYLNLQDNTLSFLPEGLFKNNPNLKEINLNNNKISSLPKNLFPSNKYLEKVYLFRNNLSHLPPRLFRQARSVKSLILGGNQIVNASEVFRDLPDIEVIDLSKNNLSYFKLEHNMKVERIDLSHNQLKVMPLINWQQHLKIENVNLQYNKLTSLSLPTLYSTNKRNPPTLNLGFNNIQHVDTQEVILNDGFLKELPKKDYENYVEGFISLYPNPFACDGSLYSFYDYLHKRNSDRKRSLRFTDFKNYTCNSPPELKGKRVMLLTANQFRHNLNDSCELPCKCFFRVVDKVNVMDCSNHSLKYFPENVPLNTQVLFFQGNSLDNVNNLNASIWENLTELYLDGNQIKSLEKLYMPPKLKILNLKGNLLKSIPQSILNFTSHVDDFQLSLSENPWNCNCSTMYFKQWITEHYQKVKDVKNVRCVNYISENGTSVDAIISIPDDKMCPINDWQYRVQLISVTTVCVILALLLFIVSVLYYRNKQTVIAYVYIHLHNVFMCFFNEEDIDEDKIFDAFVSYSGSDRDVTLALLQELEKKEPFFKLCIHERNWLPGNLISWNIINSVQNSRRTILVVTKEFLESMWFQVEFHAAYYQMLEDKIDRLIVIVKGDLPSKDSMDKELQHLLSTKTYLVWGEKWFWEKLRYALPHKKHVAINGDVMALKDKPDSVKVKCIENQIAVLSSKNKTGSKHESKQNGTKNVLNHIIQDPSNNNKTSL